jgi:hypothetical protein
MKINAKRIKTMEYMLANGRTDSLRASSIDLTGIYNSNEFIADSPSSSMFKGLFNGRKMSDSGNNLKLFGKDSNGNPTGINTSKALNLSQMFNGGILTNNNIHVIEGLDVSLCNNFSYMFSNSTNISKIDLSSWLTNLNWEERSLKFKEALEGRYNMEVHMIDERLSTMEATNYLLEADVSRKKRKQVVDGVAASIILDTYLKMKGNK